MLLYRMSHKLCLWALLWVVTVKESWQTYWVCTLPLPPLSPMNTKALLNPGSALDDRKGWHLHDECSNRAPGLWAMISWFLSLFRAMLAHEPSHLPWDSCLSSSVGSALSDLPLVCGSCLPNALSTFSCSVIVSKGMEMRALLKMCMFCRKGPQNT